MNAENVRWPQGHGVGIITSCRVSLPIKTAATGLAATPFDAWRSTGHAIGISDGPALRLGIYHRLFGSGGPGGCARRGWGGSRRSAAAAAAVQPWSSREICSSETSRPSSRCNSRWPDTPPPYGRRSTPRRPALPRRTSGWPCSLSLACWPLYHTSSTNKLFPFEEATSFHFPPWVQGNLFNSNGTMGNDSFFKSSYSSLSSKTLWGQRWRHSSDMIYRSMCILVG